MVATPQGPPPDQGIEGLLVRQSPGKIHESGVCRPLRVARDPGQGMPFGLREAGDGEPPILPEAGIDAMRRYWLVRGAVAVAGPDPPVGRPVEEGGAAD